MGLPIEDHLVVWQTSSKCHCKSPKSEMLQEKNLEAGLSGGHLLQMCSRRRCIGNVHKDHPAQCFSGLVVVFTLYFRWLHHSWIFYHFYRPTKVGLGMWGGVLTFIYIFIHHGRSHQLQFSRTIRKGHVGGVGGVGY